MLLLCVIKDRSVEGGPRPSGEHTPFVTPSTVRFFCIETMDCEHKTKDLTTVALMGEVGLALVLCTKCGTYIDTPVQIL